VSTHHRLRRTPSPLFAYSKEPSESFSASSEFAYLAHGRPSSSCPSTRWQFAKHLNRMIPPPRPLPIGVGSYADDSADVKPQRRDPPPLQCGRRSHTGSDAHQRSGAPTFEVAERHQALAGGLHRRPPSSGPNRVAKRHQFSKSPSIFQTVPGRLRRFCRDDTAHTPIAEQKPKGVREIGD
jgi:hypothetical protein